ncbi:MAG: SpoIID/LytB domain-containing protein [Solirubrobacterales bacterium]
MPDPRLRARRSVAAIAIAAVAPFAFAEAAAAKFVVKGRGFGHGIGLSQYGAYGYAKHGVGYEKIVRHYFSGTRLGSSAGENVRVLVGSGGGVSFSGASRACGKALKEKKSYRFESSGGGVALTSGGGSRLVDCGESGGARGGSTVTYSGYGELRGELLAVSSGGGLNAVNRLDIDEYVKGVVPNEVPSSWPGDALKAQAVVARSYALSTTVDGDGFDLYDDTRSQVYGGKSSEAGPTNRAVKATAGEVVENNGQIAVTYYHSTSGGRTESIQFGFPGAEPRSYLKGVKDPYDDASPHYRWNESFSRGEIESRLGGLVQGRLRDIEVLKTGTSPRIVKARVVGSAGSETVSGATLQGQLGLMSTWARFKRR